MLVGLLSESSCWSRLQAGAHVHAIWGGGGGRLKVKDNNRLFAICVSTFQSRRESRRLRSLKLSSRNGMIAWDFWTVFHNLLVYATLPIAYSVLVLLMTTGSLLLGIDRTPTLPSQVHNSLIVVRTWICTLHWQTSHPRDPLWYNPLGPSPSLHVTIIMKDECARKLTNSSQ